MGCRGSSAELTWRARPGVLAAALVLACAEAAAQAPWTVTRFPQDEAKAWWDADWWERGRLPAPANHEVRSRPGSYRSGNADVPFELHVPQGAGRFPVVVFLHGRRGIDELTRLVPLRLAARGFTVLAPDLYSGRFIDKFPVRHDPALEEDAARAKRRDAQVIVYPGVGRGFDFRPREVRTLADDLAAMDALQRTARFLNAHLPAR